MIKTFKNYMKKNNWFWFSVKRYGYGTYPITKEGYWILLIYVLELFLILNYLDTWPFFQIFLILLSTIGLVYMSKEHTKEIWKWRWGRRLP